MITISHKIDSDGVHYQTVHHSDYRTYGFRASSYAIGYEKPHYPVPSIIGRVYILPQPEMKPDAVLVSRYTPNSTPDNPRFDAVVWF